MNTINSEKTDKIRLQNSKRAMTADRGYMPHPAVQILMWSALVLTAQVLHTFELIALATVFVLISFRMCAVKVLYMLRRTRWLLFSVFVIYAYSGPGDALLPQIGILSPMHNGVLEGMLQLLRLLVLLTSLSVLLTLLSQAQLVTGLYVLFRPLGLFGLSRERIAVRLALTLQYAEGEMQISRGNWRNTIEQMLEPVQINPGDIALHVSPFSGLDWIIILIMMSAAILIGVWL